MTTTVFNSKVRTVLRGSYSHHYRRLLPDLLAALEFRANNTTHRPVMDAVELLQRYKDIPVSDRPYYSRLDRVPLNGVVPREWRDAVLDDTDRVERIPYELCVLKALREAIRRREIWVVGANRWRNPDDDLPARFRGQPRRALRRPAYPFGMARSSSRTSNSGWSPRSPRSTPHLLGFKLLPRDKTLPTAKLYRAEAGSIDAWPTLAPVLSNRAID